MIRISEEVHAAVRGGRPVVALESTVLAHGLPYPRNLEVGRGLEEAVRAAGAVPATVAVLGGVPLVGIDAAQMESIASGAGARKLSTRDLPVAVGRGEDGATTVAATLWIASRAGVRVFATGGIGGVHRDAPLDVSADLTELGRSTMIVVCSGAKAILDLPATREALETHGVLVVGWGTDELPGFYSRETGLGVDVRVEDEGEVVELWRAHHSLGSPGSLLVCVPPPADSALPASEVEEEIGRAMERARKKGVRGKEITPFLLREVAELTGGRSLEANVALLRNNADVGARIARALAGR